MSPLCTRICPCPFFEVTPPGAAPGPPVKTGARARRFRGCNKKMAVLPKATFFAFYIELGFYLKDPRFLFFVSFRDASIRLAGEFHRTYINIYLTGAEISQGSHQKAKITP